MISPQKRRNDFVFSFCSVALNASFCLKKRKLRKNKSEVFRVKIPQRKVTKCNTYKNSLFFTIVSLQFSRKLYYGGCLISPHNSVKKRGVVQKTTVFIQIKSPERSEFLLNCIQIPSISNNLNVNPLEINSPESHNLLENSILAKL